jgi:hypothetical protein
MIKYFIFGCGYHGRAVYRKLRSKKKNIIGWVDNDKKKINKKLFGLPIYSILKLKQFTYSKIIFSGRSIKEQLIQYSKLNLEKKKIEIWDNFKIKPTKNLALNREKDSTKILKKIIKTINENKIKYWVDSSGLLQLIRDKKLSILSDFDLSFEYKNHQKILKLFKTNNSFKVIKKKISDNDFKIFIIGKNKYQKFEPVCFDFHFKKKNKKFFIDAFNLKRRIPLKYLNNLTKYKFKNNITLIIPKNYINYLEYLYGKNKWKRRVRFFKNPLAKKNRPFLGPIDK